MGRWGVTEWPRMLPNGSLPERPVKARDLGWALDVPGEENYPPYPSFPYALQQRLWGLLALETDNHQRPNLTLQDFRLLGELSPRGAPLPWAFLSVPRSPPGRKTPQ